MDLYLDLLEKCLLGTIYEDVSQDPWSGGTYRPSLREEGKDWPSRAHSMIGVKRMRNLRLLCEDVLAQGIRGDFAETGVWRGGACILMRGVLKAYQVSDRVVWCADSFQGLPRPSYAQDEGDPHHTFAQLRVSLEEVRHHFGQYGLLDEQVKFLPGWFHETLPAAPIRELAILRLDGDMYGSTMEALSALYPRVSPGGFVIVDDYALPGCKQAIDDFRKAGSIADKIEAIDWTGVFWRKTRTSQ